MKQAVFPKMYGAVTVGQKGQIVIPSQVRKMFGVKTGDKLVVFAKNDGPIALVPSEQFNQFLEHASSLVQSVKQKPI